ncbi:MAG: decaprenyl-phosphate phosphoribosyltransferase [Spirochaetales bacterium]|nr:decaprenyl-phosphate phosphoribosyltransferase [Spirochaetales bacterium]
MKFLKTIYHLLRIKQWVKNLFVLTPLFFAKKLTDINSVMLGIFAFIAFNMISSVVYIVNDICDIEADRKHPRKKFRPIPAGDIPLPAAVIIAIILFSGAGGLSLFVNVQFIICISTYFLLNILYSFRGKHVVIFDVLCIATGFVLRVIGGAVAIDVLPTNWIMMGTFFLALFLGFGKRRNEFLSLEKEKGAHRKVLNHYDENLLNHLIFISCGIAIISYAMYTLSPSEKFNNGDKLIYTIPIVTFILFRYVFIIWKKDEGDPTEVVFHDAMLIGAGFFLLLLIIGLIYGPAF